MGSDIAAVSAWGEGWWWWWVNTAHGRDKRGAEELVCGAAPKLSLTHSGEELEMAHAIGSVKVKDITPLVLPHTQSSAIHVFWHNPSKGRTEALVEQRHKQV